MDSSRIRTTFRFSVRGVSSSRMSDKDSFRSHRLRVFGAVPVSTSGEQREQHRQEQNSLAISLHKLVGAVSGIFLPFLAVTGSPVNSSVSWPFRHPRLVHIGGSRVLSATVPGWIVTNKRGDALSRKDSWSSADTWTSDWQDGHTLSASLIVPVDIEPLRPRIEPLQRDAGGKCRSSPCTRITSCTSRSCLSVFSCQSPRKEDEISPERLSEVETESRKVLANFPAFQHRVWRTSTLSPGRRLSKCMTRGKLDELRDALCKGCDLKVADGLAPPDARLLPRPKRRPGSWRVDLRPRRVPKVADWGDYGWNT